MTNIASNLQNVRQRVDEAITSAGRNPEDVLVLAISKTMPVELVHEAAAAGQLHFGENRVQEARDKVPQAPEGLSWHLVGHLQGNKAKYCPGIFQWIHSIDSVQLAREIARRYRESGKVCKTLVQVSVSGEEVKFGCDPGETAEILSVLLQEEGVEPMGLMTMPPWNPDPEVARPFFKALREHRDDLARQGFPAGSLTELSMGMTGDFEAAIEEGATIVRIGTAIFGKRNP
jgi:pyridoxal phosphate enzyme (YggS family)